MPPAAPDDLIRQQNRLDDDSPFSSDQPRIIPEHETVGKSKKKKAKKAKAKAAAGSPPEEIIAPPAPSLPEPEPEPEPEPALEQEPEPEPEKQQDLEPSSWPDADSLFDHHAPLAEPSPPSPPPPVTSPMLDALGSLRNTVDKQDLNRRTDTWAKSVPFGKSPPTNLMDAELPQESPLTFPHVQGRGGFSQPSSASPPTRIHPFSYGSGFRSSMMRSRQPSVDRGKSHSYGSPMSNLAPPPHMPQAHFYGAPEVEIPNQPRTGPEKTYSFCGFDVLPSLSSRTPRSGTTVVVGGMDGRVEIHAVEDRRSRLVGQITGLNGRVLEAKILSDSSQSDAPDPTQPHVAMIVHGPMVPAEAGEEGGLVSTAASEVNDVPASVGRGQPDRRSAKEDAPFYQTRVEVYSLRSGSHMATLFAGKPIPSMEYSPGLASLAPSSVDGLKIYSSNNHILVASGTSGELYVYHQTPHGTYQCLGKTWTSVQSSETRRYSTSSSSTDPDGSHMDSPRTPASERPIMGIQGRWLAVAPPSASSKESIKGTVPAEILHSRAQGIDLWNAPAMPSVNCATDVGEGESFLNKVARGVTQELVKGARFLGDQGMAAWHNYWNNPQSQGTSPQRHARTPESPTPSYGAFPPTHASDTQSASSSEADVVSIIDLKRFEDGIDAKTATLQPVATFQVPNGCSFLSLSPNGLMLFTASKKGDVQYVWDLMQLRHCRAMNLMVEDFSYQNANVRQVARYARLTTSSIVDVIWAGPAGDRLAIVTRKGTVHVYDLPGSAFQWPPFRRARPATKKSPTVDPTSDEVQPPATGGNPLSAAMKLVGGRTQPFFSAVRGRVPTTSAAFPNMSGFALPAAASLQGGKVVAAGLSKSMGAAATGTVHNIRHAGENRLHLTGLARDPAAARVIWILSKGLIYLGIVDEGHYKLYRLKLGPTNHKHRQFHSIIGGKEAQYKLPESLQCPSGPAPLLQYDSKRTTQGNLILPSAGTQQPHTVRNLVQPLSQAEIETNTPYQPFHTDQRVGLHVFNTDNGVTDPTLLSPGNPWVFGGDIPVTKVHVRSYNNSGEDDLADDEQEDAAIHGHSFGAGGDMENLISLANSTGHVEEVVITTRRKKKYSAPSKAEDEIFEDDCEVLDFARDRV